ncbi:MAG: RDD family protein [Candidatus Thermoplasmatota archaeon]|nr:RDD family protein [Candidatus Thermoplasmatota archaeon]
MSRTGKYRSLGLKSKGSGVRANPFFRVLAYIIDAIIIRYIFQGIVFILGTRGLISDTLVKNIFLYLGEGLAPFRGGGIVLKQFIFINSLQDLMIHITYSALFLAYFIVLESEKIGGQTIGKKVFGLEVVDRTRSKISFEKSVLRNSTKYLLRVPILNFMMGFLEIILLLFYSTRSGDILADTEVISVSGKGIIDRLK